jgi:hypothetical protein
MAQAEQVPNPIDTPIALRMRPCRNCPRGEMVRMQTPRLFRMLRRVPTIYPRMFRCDACHTTVLRWRGMRIDE